MPPADTIPQAAASVVSLNAKRAEAGAAFGAAAKRGVGIGQETDGGALLPPEAKRLKRSGFEVQKAVVFALFLRELRTRFGKYSLGYLWALLEPAVHVLVLVSLFTFFLGRSGAGGITFPVFFVAGIVPWFLFNNIAVRSLRAVQSNEGLFNYRLVKPIDTVLARALLEMVIYGAVYVTLLLAVRLLGEPVYISNILVLLGSFLLLAWFSTGLGLVFMVIGDAFSEAEKLIPMLIQPLYFISGIMISVKQIPVDYLPYLLWNPIFHVIEIARGTLSPGYEVGDVSLFYVFLCALTVSVVGLWLYRVREKSMLTR